MCLSQARKHFRFSGLAASDFLGGQWSIPTLSADHPSPLLPVPRPRALTIPPYLYTLPSLGHYLGLLRQEHISRAQPLPVAIRKFYCVGVKQESLCLGHKLSSLSWSS